ncbi:hypothetical protein RHGRI_033629 [Rhododendron griersonianum]|uniref:Actin cross-linking n=1 Tax=Rhododendron griersonianum TaxID=479676 RepID=A0AAV6HXI8_9ERIC|nr:hypothetical protein RHGRI_033629 [Rhododendron griersonianum]
MEFFNKTKAVKLRSHHNKYLVADDDKKSVRQSRNGSTRKARWLVERVDHNPEAIRLKSLHGVYLTASTTAFLLGFTGNKVTQTQPDHPRDLSIEWVPVRDGFQVKLVTAFGGTCLRANGGTRPWKDSVTHDVPSVTKSWVLWDVEAVEIPENEELTDYLSLVSSVSSLSDELFLSEIGSEVGSPLSIHSNSSPMVPVKKNDAKKGLYCSWSPNVKLPSKNTSGMELFHKAKAVRLRSNHEKYLTAEEDEESVTQARNGASRNARWAVEFLETDDNIIRLKSCYGKYLMASNMPFLLGMTGRKVIQTAGRKDSSVEWEPIREGNQVKLRTRHGNFLRANGGIPPWRNSVTHDVPNRTATQDWILWDVDVVEILLLQLPQPKPSAPSESDLYPDSFESPSSSESNHSFKSPSFGRQESNDCMGSSVSRAADGRVIYYSIADERGNVEEGLEGLSFTFKGNGLYELTKRLEEETGLEEIIVCSRSPLNGKLYPLRLQLPPKNVDMHVVVLQSSSRGE